MTLTEFKHHRETQLLSMKSEKPLDKERFLNILRDQDPQECLIIVKAFADEMENQGYNHGQLSKAQYMAHPYRVARRLIEHFPEIDETYIQLALCHNIIEVSVVTENLSDYLGPDLMKHINTLTVDRVLQWDPAYKKTYYEKIAEEKITRIIKIFDKLDNLFILSENNDKEVKLMYLKEIENYLIPFVKLDIPTLEDYFKSLLEINYMLIDEPI
jgi:(p)ppGpp synthase/HD superfamily hydrolase